MADIANTVCGACLTCWDRTANYRRQSKLAEAKRADIETELALGRTFRVKEDVAYEPADLKLERSLETLRRKRSELDDMFETVKQRVKLEESKHLVRTREVGGWMERVQLLLEKEVREILEQGAQEMEKGFQGVGGVSLPQSQRNSTSYYQLSKHAEEKRATLEEELRKASSFTVFTYKPDDPPMSEIPLEQPVGLGSSFEEVWKWVQDEGVRRIGIYGMGGVGKTTLLKKIHNEILGMKDKYDVVAWIVVSRPTNRSKIQEIIWEKLHLSKSEWDCKSESDRASKIFSEMKKRSFLLFLDDVWEEIDLLNLGIPYRGHEWKSKIIFTTRSEERCLRRLDLESCEGLRSLIIPKPSLRRMEHLRVLWIYKCEFEEISVVKGESYGCGGETRRSDGSGSPPPPHTLPSSYYPELTSTSSCLESQNCFRSLKWIHIGFCGSLKEVTAVIYHAPSLTHLSISLCYSIRELISGDVEDSHVDRTLSCLIHLQLIGLQKLESICKRALPFPSLKSLVVEHCPKLEKLPLDSNSRGSARQLSRIYGGEKWWDGLRWDDPETKQYFSTKFVSNS
ncbi:hypothetical protein CRG98_043527 [Punica granatum]|uniref:AAA+ ATPase domain-containing protein n=1 Tax=Punica granatum TaxID=22663 RepID=A0A2I0HXR7_PUNGR|nr:hypothetical protein CRG98_043527 [Punica granatum]